MEVNSVALFVWGAAFGSSLIALGMVAGHSIWAPKKPKNGRKTNGNGKGSK
jgi:hypothetical protein